MLCHGRGRYLHFMCYKQQHLSNIHLICRSPRQALRSRTMEHTFACIKWIKRGHVNLIYRLTGSRIIPTCKDAVASGHLVALATFHVFKRNGYPNMAARLIISRFHHVDTYNCHKFEPRVNCFVIRSDPICIQFAAFDIIPFLSLLFSLSFRQNAPECANLPFVLATKPYCSGALRSV